MFAGVEKMIRELFLPRLFFGNTKTFSTIVGTLSMMPFKMARLGLLNPLTSVNEIYLSYHQRSAELIRVVMGGGEFSNANHLRTLGEEICDGQKDWEIANKTKLKGLVQELEGTDSRLILRAKRTGDCTNAV